MSSFSNENQCSPLLTVVVPVYNEARTVVALLDMLYNEETNKEIIIVDDGSTDGSGNLIDEWVRDIRHLNKQTGRIVHEVHECNQGKGRAIRSALMHAQGDYFLIQDADLELCPSNYGCLLVPLITNQAQFVVGSRVTSRGGFRGMHWCGIALENMMVRMIYGIRLSDAACCYKVTRTSNVRLMGLRCEGFEFCPEYLAKAARLNLSMQEVKVHYSPRPRSEGKKIRFVRDGFWVFITLLRYRNWVPDKVDLCAETPRGSTGSACPARH